MVRWNDIRDGVDIHEVLYVHRSDLLVLVCAYPEWSFTVEERSKISIRYNYLSDCQKVWDTSTGKLEY